MQRALKAKKRLGDVILVTTDEVLVEFLNCFSGKGSKLRGLAAEMARSILDNPNVRVHQQTRGSFLSGLELYSQRVDKKYSLVDCVSMIVMRKQGLQEILTGDHHFAQEGFTVLMGAGP
jgi:predicted nucleic acid-binding protein